MSTLGKTLLGSALQNAEAESFQAWYENPEKLIDAVFNRLADPAARKYFIEKLENTVSGDRSMRIDIQRICAAAGKNKRGALAPSAGFERMLLDSIWLFEQELGSQKAALLKFGEIFHPNARDSTKLYGKIKQQYRTARRRQDSLGK